MLGLLLLAFFGLSFGSYFLLHCICAFFYKTQNLKRRYDARWALVTGSSSGIGKSLAWRLAGQGLNVVLVALQDDLLDATFAEFQSAFPGQQFRKVGANLAKPGYMEGIGEATHDIDVQIVFLNAGYILTGFFHTRSAADIGYNLECNMTSAVHITHHFLNLMLAKKLRGCFVFTSSAAALLPSPFSVSYAATKAFISAFGASLAPEVKSKGIDVLVFHPSPVASRFYEKTHQLDMMDFFKKFAVSPDELPDTVFASIGRSVWRDVGPTAVCFRMLMKVVDYNFLVTFFSAIAHIMPDYRRYNVPQRAAQT